MVSRPVQSANMLFDELTIDRFRSLTSDGYAIVNIGVFILFGIQDWQNWNFSAANTLLIDLSAMMFLVWGGLMVVFASGMAGGVVWGSIIKSLNRLKAAKRG